MISHTHVYTHTPLQMHFHTLCFLPSLLLCQSQTGIQSPRLVLQMEIKIITLNVMILVTLQDLVFS